MISRGLRWGTCSRCRSLSFMSWGSGGRARGLGGTAPRCCSGWPLIRSGDLAGPVRWLLLATLGVLALRSVRDEELRLPAVFARTLVESVAFAMLLGPLLIWMLTFFEASGFTWDVESGVPLDAPGLGHALRLIGAAPWEELLFRVGAFGICYLLFARISLFFGCARRLAHWLGDLGALLGSSVLFAAFHLNAFQRVLGRTGEEFDGSVFLWRLLAGLLLAGLFRWRGLGTCAWTHGFFNLGLALGAGPGVFLGP